MKIVFNSSPLIFLASLDFLDKFIDGTAEFYCPEWVRKEINDKSDVASQSINRLIESNRLISRPTNLFSLANRLNSRLGKGESEAISLGIEIQTNYIILDDFAARKEALRLGLNVKGTLAVIKKLHLSNKISIDNLDELYQQLLSLNFRVKRELFDAIFCD
jgi:predicted nucleic acid-binding protein